MASSDDEPKANVSCSDTDVEDDDAEADIAFHEDWTLKGIEWLHERIFLPDVARILHWQEGSEWWSALKSALERGDLGALVFANPSTIQLNGKWIAHLASFEDEAVFHIERGGSLPFNVSDPVARELFVPAVVELISFETKAIEALWPIAVDHNWRSWRLRSRRTPKSVEVQKLARTVRDQGYVLLTEAVGLVGEWLRQDSHPAWRAARPVAWQAIKRGIQVRNLAADCLVNGAPTRFNPRWADFIAPKDGCDYAEEGAGHMWFNTALGLKCGVEDLPRKISAVTFTLDDLDRIWPGCVSEREFSPSFVVHSRRPIAVPTKASAKDEIEPVKPQARPGRPTKAETVHQGLRLINGASIPENELYREATTAWEAKNGRGTFVDRRTFKKHRPTFVN